MKVNDDGNSEKRDVICIGSMPEMNLQDSIDEVLLDSDLQSLIKYELNSYIVDVGGYEYVGSSVSWY